MSPCSYCHGNDCSNVRSHVPDIDCSDDMDEQDMLIRTAADDTFVRDLRWDIDPRFKKVALNMLINECLLQIRNIVYEPPLNHIVH